MKYLTSHEISEKWGISERTVRNYCSLNRIEGAYLDGKTWRIPSDSVKPERSNKSKFKTNFILNRLAEEKDMRLSGGLYHKTQIEFSYNSNHIEGNSLTHDQTRYIYETNTLGVVKSNVKSDDIIETINHFKCVDFIIDNAKKPVSEKMIKKLHYILKSNTSDSKKDWFNVGEYKKVPNFAGDAKTCDPKKVPAEMKKLLSSYNSIMKKTFEDIVEFHVKFERIHPFQDGNGRVGRLIMFKECLVNNIVPFIIEDNKKAYYYRGIKEWGKEKGYLIDTCLSCQDDYQEWLKYFKIKI